MLSFISDKYIHIYTHTHIIYFSILIFSDRNIICTSRNKWFVKSTINDEHVRNKIIYILLDSFCNEFLEHAFFLFQFLLKDQSSYYNPIGEVDFYTFLYFRDFCHYITYNYIMTKFNNIIISYITIYKDSYLIFRLISLCGQINNIIFVKNGYEFNHRNGPVST